MRETHYLRTRAQPVSHIKCPQLRQYLSLQPVVLKEMEQSSRSRLIRLCSMHRENAAIRTLKCVGEVIAIAFLTTNYFVKRVLHACAWRKYRQRHAALRQVTMPSPYEPQQTPGSIEPHLMAVDNHAVGRAIESDDAELTGLPGRHNYYHRSQNFAYHEK